MPEPPAADTLGTLSETGQLASAPNDVPRARPRECSYAISAVMRSFFATERREYPLDLRHCFEPVTGKLNSLISRKKFPALFGIMVFQPATKPHKLRGLPGITKRSVTPLLGNYPDNFPVSREMLLESGSPQTASTAIQSKLFTMCILSDSNEPDVHAKSGFRFSLENLCRRTRGAKPVPVYRSERAPETGQFLNAVSAVRYKTPKWMEYFLTVCATLALEGGPIFWVATHRKHHQCTDRAGDPHSPREGGLWAHVGWLLTGEVMHNDSANLLPYVPDLRKDKFHVWISHWHWVPITLLGIILLAAGGWKFLLWGIFFRTVLGLHSTWLVNSATHMWGSRRFPTGDTSRNSFWVALLTFGEGWHNNHHAHPQSSRHGLAWYELDLNWCAIFTLRMVGLAWDVKAWNLSMEEGKEKTVLQGAPV